MTDPHAAQSTPPASNPDPSASIPEAPQPVQSSQPTPYATAPAPADPFAAPAFPDNNNPYAVAQPRNTTSTARSIVSMVLGLIGLLLSITGWGLLFSIGAVILGHLGQRREKTAKAYWLTGIITGYVGSAINLLIFGAIVLVSIVNSTATSTV